MILKRDSVAHRLIFAVDLNKTGYSTCQVMSSFWGRLCTERTGGLQNTAFMPFECGLEVVLCFMPELRTDQTVDNTTFETIRDALESASDSQIAFLSRQVLAFVTSRRF